MRVCTLAVLLAFDTAGLLLAGCSGSAYSNPQSPPTITVQPANQAVTAGQSASFSVTATGAMPLSYQWQKNGSAISGATAATYTTPPTTSADNGAQFKVVVSNAKGSATSNAATLTVTAASSVQITTTSLPNGQVQAAYSATLQATGGTTPYTWSMLSGSLPAGLTLTASSGAISGTPTTAGTSSFTVQVTDSATNKASAGFSITITGGTGGGNAPFGHIVIVLEENTDYSSVVGTNAMPYLNTLISQYGLATQYYATTHPSIGNYMDLTTGQILTNDDGQTPTTFPVSQDNVVRELIAAGKTWKGYAEDLPSVGYTGDSVGNYAVRHFPLAYMTDVQNDATQKQNLVPFTQFATDLGAGKLPNYSWITPNLCNDAHDCSLSTADTWLQTNIDPLIKNSAFQKDGLLIITFDESGGDNTNGGGRVVCVVISPASSKKAFQSTTLFQHPSVLRLTLEGLGVKQLPGAAASAPPMWEFFTFPAP
jgi:phosphatidylinositol-3-phosphatase